MTDPRRGQPKQRVDLFSRLLFGQRLVGLFRQQPADELQHLIGHQLGDQFRQRPVDVSQLFRYKRYITVYRHPHTCATSSLSIRISCFQHGDQQWYQSWETRTALPIRSAVVNSRKLLWKRERTPQIFLCPNFSFPGNIHSKKSYFRALEL